MQLFFYELYLDEIEDLHIFDTFYGFVIAPFFKDGLFEIRQYDDIYQIVVKEGVPTVTFCFYEFYHTVPYHPDYTFDIYFNLFSLLYVLTRPDDTFGEDHTTLLKNLLDIVASTPFKLNKNEIDYGTLFELENLENDDYFKEEYCFRVFNPIG
jgi:hypothetical protein